MGTASCIVILFILATHHSFSPESLAIPRVDVITSNSRDRGADDPARLETIRASNFGSALDAQRDAAKIIRDSGATSINLDGWFQNPDYQLLSGVPAASMPNSSQKTIMVVSATKYYFLGTYDDFLNQKNLCSEVLYSSENLLVCWPKNN